MAEDFDIGPLTWVKDEIDQALSSVLENLSAVAANPDDLAPLRFSQTHLYQVSGALDMVGLEGCKRFCAEMEKIAGAIEKKTVSASPETFAALTHAVETLRKYLDDLLGGAADYPLKLFPALQALGALHGQSYDESELFFVDTSVRAPKDLPSKELNDAELPAYLAVQRSAFQKSLLGWLKGGSAEALSQMAAAIENVRQIQKQPGQKALWWSATGLLAALPEGDLAQDAGVKRLFRRIDQQLRSLSESSARAADSLLRNILYYVALSKSTDPLVSQVKQVFELDHFMPKSVDGAGSAIEITDAELANVEQLKTVLGSLKDVWAEVSEGKEGALDQVMNGLGEIIMQSQDLSNQTVANLFSAIHELATAMDLDGTRINEAVLIEGATALNLLEDALNGYARHDGELIKRMQTQIQRLQDVMGGGPMADFSGMPMSDHLDSDVLLAVAQQVTDALKVAEQSLDTYFRNPTETQVLESVDKPLQQVLAAFDMLDMPVPTAIVKASLQLIKQFQEQTGTPDASLFELVAESLSMVGFYVEELPRRRMESEEALDAALGRLQARLDKSAEPAAVAEVAAVVDQLESDLAPAVVEPPPVPVKKAKGVQVSVSVAPLEPVSTTPAVEVPAVVVGNEVEAAIETSNTATAAVDAVEVETGDIVTDQAFDPELLDIYLTEAEEVLATIAQNLQALRVNATDHEALVEVRRGFHTLKGSGRTVGLVALGEVAWAVERLLNQVMERKVIPSSGQIAFIEEASAAFAGWAAKLREQAVVELNHATWQARAARLENEKEAPKPAAQSEEVIIGGTHKLSRTLFNIFLGEASQHMQTLRDGLAVLSTDSTSRPTEASRRAAHTLASNAGTAGFKAICDLARALEHWLDVHQGNWTDQSLILIQRVVDALDDMMRKAAQLRQPKQISGLMAALKEATIDASTTAEVPLDEAASVLDDLNLDLPPSLDITQDLPPATEVPVAAVADMDFDLPELDMAQQVVTEPSTPESKPVVAEEVPAPTAAPSKKTAEPVEKAATKAVKKAAPVSAVDQELITMFTEEARELVPQVGTALRTWRANPTESEHPDSLQRALHTLKGSARMAGQAELGDTVHGMEDRVIKALKNQVSMADFDDLFLDLDRISALLEELTGASVGGRAPEKADAAAKPAGRSTDRRAQFLRLRSDILDRLINEAGEISIARSRMDREMQGFKNFSLDLTESVFRLRNYLREMEIEAESQLQSRMTHLQETHEAFDPLEFDRFTRLQELTRMMAESVNDVATIQHGLLMNLDETESALQQQNRMNRELQHGLMNVRMVPFSLISERLQRIVRQTARELEKQVDMSIDGEGVEIDRSVLEKIGAPLEHLLRNAVAHGMETVAERKKLKKGETGSIALKVRQESDEIILTVTDDGSGIKLDRVREKAIERGLLSADQEITEQALLSVIFEPGFSTAENISQIAGRGVGLDAVRSDITALGGRIDVNNAPGQGAVFTIYLPVTLSVSQVVLVRAGGKVFAVPSVMVEQVQKLKPAGLSEAYDRKYIDWSGRQYPMHFLGKLIGDQEHEPEEQRYTPIILLRSGNYRIALHVDEIIGNQEVVMKSIGAQLSRVPGIVGATVMGDGSIILITNPVQLANREVLAVGSVKVTAAPAVVAEDGKTVVMVVDDSLTMRKVLGRLLEREGYEVVVAKDGMEGIQKLQESLPHIILSDIEMPRMDGFEFSRNVRADARTAGIPIIIISSRTAEKHQNHAKELGVNAFLGKPVQDDELIAQITALIGKAAPVATA